MNTDYNENDVSLNTDEQAHDASEVVGENIHENTHALATEKKHTVLTYIGIFIIIVVFLVAGSWFGWKYITRTDEVATPPEDSGLVESPQVDIVVPERVSYEHFEKVGTENSYFMQTAEGLVQLDTTDLLRQGNFFISTSSEKVYYFEQTYSEDIETDVILKYIKGANALEFAVFDDVLSDSRYASDLNTVYFLYQEPSDKTFNELRIIEGADPNSFKAGIVRDFDVPQGEVTQGWLSKDKNHVYYQDTIFTGADPETFRISNNVLLNFDKNNVYLKRKIIPNADPYTYEVIVDTNTEILGVLVGKDTQSLFVDYCQMDGVDTDSVTLETLRVRTDNLIFIDSKGNFKFVYNRGTNKCSIVRF